MHEHSSLMCLCYFCDSHRTVSSSAMSFVQYFWVVSLMMAFMPFNSLGHILTAFQTTPPLAKHRYNPQFLQDVDGDDGVETWDPNSDTNVWEYSGLFEGDIMLYHTSELSRNAIRNETSRWPKATVPYYIDDSFSNEEVSMILGAMQEYHNKTCIRFRPYAKSDTNWIEIKSDYSGCFSSVGKKKEGQVVNLYSPHCLRHGVIIHELMHAIGFFHQQSAADRDDFVKIHWDNIKEGRQNNFRKCDEDQVTDFDVSYDYDSVMHYSAKAFSKNGNITIEPLEEDAVLGQRVGLSEKDIMKINLMYREECNIDIMNVLEQQPLDRPEDNFFRIMKFVEQNFGF